MLKECRKKNNCFFKKTIVLPLLVSLVLLCLRSDGEGVGAERITTKVAFGTTGWVQPLPFAVGQEEGIFASAGLDVQTIFIRGGPIVLAAIVGNSVDYGLVAGIPAAQAIAKRVPVVIVGGYRARVDYVLIGARGMSKLADLKGKVVGVTGAGGLAEFTVVESLKRKSLIRNRDYQILNAGNSPARIIALEKGQIQAAPFTPSESVILEQKGYPMLLDIGEVFSEFPSTVVLTSRDRLNNRQGEVVKFLRALKLSMELIRTDKKKAALIGIKKFGGDSETQLKALDYYAANYTVSLTKENVQVLISAAGIESEAEKIGGPERFFSKEIIGKALQR